MNESTALDWTWFNTTKGTVGIAKVKTYGGKIEYRISPVDGFMEKMDVQQVVAWGAAFPAAAGRELFKGRT
jgi:hypothetical protein